MSNTYSADYSDLYNWIMPEVPNCPPPLIDQHIYAAFRQFCRDTNAWNETQPLLTIRANVATYPIDLPTSYASVWSVMRVQRNNRTLRPVTDYTIDAADLTLTGVPSQDEANALEIRAAFSPVFGTGKLPRHILNDWGHDIATRVKADLMKMPDKTWTNLQQAMLYAQEAYNAYANAKIKVQRELAANRAMFMKPKHPWV